MADEPAERTNKNVERGRATRAHVIGVATRLFTAHGYDGTSIEAVQAESGISRGSLYHHFPGKEALFRAVLEEVGAGIARQGEDAARDAADPVALLRIGGLLWIRNAGDPVVRQIMLIDGPAVLGWERWRELDEQGPLGLIRDCLAYAAGMGSIEHRHVDAFAHIVLAAANEVAMMVARADNPAGALADGESAFAEFLDRLLGARLRAGRAPGSGVSDAHGAVDAGTLMSLWAGGYREGRGTDGAHATGAPGEAREGPTARRPGWSSTESATRVVIGIKSGRRADGIGPF